MGLISEESSTSVEIQEVWAEVWESIEGGIIGSFQRDGQLGEGFSLAEALAERLRSPTAEAMLLYSTMRERVRHGNGIEKARKDAERLLELDTSGCPEWMDPHESAHGCLHECDNLNIGQAAPHFAEPDIDGRMIDLQDFRGRIVVLNFWDTTCPFCPGEFPHLRGIRQKYQDAVCLIGVSRDQEVATLRRYLETADLDWPHILETSPGRGPISTRYNLLGVPSIYVIDQKGKLAAKRVRGDEIMVAVDATVN